VKIVIDTNVMISGVFFGGAPKEILNLWLSSSAFNVAVSENILDEYQRILARFDEKRKTTFAKDLIPLICSVSDVVETTSSKSYSRDPDDDKFIDCALEAKAIYIVSGDNDLLVLGSVENVEIVTAAQFLERFKRK
jgi:uncharacterized protein